MSCRTCHATRSIVAAAFEHVAWLEFPGTLVGCDEPGSMPVGWLPTQMVPGRPRRGSPPGPHRQHGHAHLVLGDQAWLSRMPNGWP